MCDVVDVSFSTFMGSRKLRETCELAVVLGDECGQATEPETLVPLMSVGSLTRTVLVGDPDELPPRCDSPHVRGEPDRSLLERLMGVAGFKVVKLRIQYRVHPAIAKWPFKEFYHGEVQNGVAKSDRNPVKTSFSSCRGCHLQFINIDGREEPRGTSYWSPH